MGVAVIGGMHVWGVVCVLCSCASVIGLGRGIIIMRSNGSTVGGRWHLFHFEFREVKKK